MTAKDAPLNADDLRLMDVRDMADPRDPSKGKDFPGTPRPGDPNDPTRRDPEHPHPQDPSRGTPMRDPNEDDPARREYPDPNPKRDPDRPEHGGDTQLMASFAPRR